MVMAMLWGKAVGLRTKHLCTCRGKKLDNVQDGTVGVRT